MSASGRALLAAIWLQAFVFATAAGSQSERGGMAAV